MSLYYEHGGIQIWHGDCREVLPTLPKCDLVLTDPPYGIGESGGEKSRYGPGRTHFQQPKHEDFGWDEQRPSRTTFDLIMSAAPVWFIFGGNYFTDYLPPSMGWLYWDKRLGGDFSDGELIYTNQRRALRSFSLHSFTGLKGGQLREHPTQKPIALMKWCLRFTPDAKTVIDPFCGSGSVLVAAKATGRQAIGIDIEERYCAIAAKRLSQEVLAFT